MNVPIAIVDWRAPQQAIDGLREEFDVFLFCNSMTYEAINGHPDICVFQGESGLVLAPNSPQELISFLNLRAIPFQFGLSHIGQDLRSSTLYNCVETEQYLIHKVGYTDATIQRVCSHKPLLAVPQAYTRCSLLYLGNTHCITSDKGIDIYLRSHGYNVLFVSSKGILLPPYTHGFIGGCFGIYNKKIYCIGSLSYHVDGNSINTYCNALGYSIVELYDGPLFDGGGIFFIV